jgi:hypothetical protein
MHENQLTCSEPLLVSHWTRFLGAAATTFAPHGHLGIAASRPRSLQTVCLLHQAPLLHVQRNFHMLMGELGILQLPHARVPSFPTLGVVPVCFRG